MVVTTVLKLMLLMKVGCSYYLMVELQPTPNLVQLNSLGSGDDDDDCYWDHDDVLQADDDDDDGV